MPVLPQAVVPRVLQKRRREAISTTGATPVAASLAGETAVLHTIVNYLAYFGTTLLLLIVAGIVYVRFTPGNELALVRQGNVAAAIALAGAMIGYALVVYSATAHGSTWLEMIVWSIISLAVQILAVELITLLIHDKWKDEIAKGDVAHGVALGAFSLAVGLLNAGCLTP